MNPSVQLIGFASEELNGKKGILKTGRDDDGHYAIKLEDPEKRIIKTTSKHFQIIASSVMEPVRKRLSVPNNCFFRRLSCYFFLNFCRDG